MIIKQLLLNYFRWDNGTVIMLSTYLLEIWCLEFGERIGRSTVETRLPMSCQLLTIDDGYIGFIILLWQLLCLKFSIAKKLKLLWRTKVFRERNSKLKHEYI